MALATNAKPQTAICAPRSGASMRRTAGPARAPPLRPKGAVPRAQRDGGGATSAPEAPPASGAPAPPREFLTTEGGPLTADEAASLRRALGGGAAAGAESGAAAGAAPLALTEARAAELRQLLRRGLSKEAKDLSELEGAILAAEQASWIRPSWVAPSHPLVLCVGIGTRVQVQAS